MIDYKQINDFLNHISKQPEVNFQTFTSLLYDLVTDLYTRNLIDIAVEKGILEELYKYRNKQKPLNIFEQNKTEKNIEQILGLCMVLCKIIPIEDLKSGKFIDILHNPPKQGKTSKNFRRKRKNQQHTPLKKKRNQKRSTPKRKKSPGGSHPKTKSLTGKITRFKRFTRSSFKKTKKQNNKLLKKLIVAAGLLVLILIIVRVIDLGGPGEIAFDINGTYKGEVFYKGNEMKTVEARVTKSGEQSYLMKVNEQKPQGFKKAVTIKFIEGEYKSEEFGIIKIRDKKTHILIEAEGDNNFLFIKPK